MADERVASSDKRGSHNLHWIVDSNTFVYVSQWIKKILPCVSEIG